MKRLLVLVVLCSTALVLFPGRPALSASPAIKALQESITALQESITGLQESITGLQESITGFKWTLLNGRFTDNGDGTVKDNLTGLVWTKNAGLIGWKNFPPGPSACAPARRPGPPCPAPSSGELVSQVHLFCSLIKRLSYFARTDKSLIIKKQEGLA